MFWDMLDFFFGYDVMNAISDFMYPIYCGICSTATTGDDYFNTLATALQFILT